MEDAIFFCGVSTLPCTIWCSHSMRMQKYAVSKFDCLQFDLWPNFLACQSKPVLLASCDHWFKFQSFKLQVQKMGPACLYRSTSRKTFPLSTREIMTCLCNTFLKTFFRTRVMSPRLLCWLSKQSLFSLTIPYVILSPLSLTWYHPCKIWRWLVENIQIRHCSPENSTAGIIWWFLYLLAWCTSNLFKQGFCQMSKKKS